MFLAENDFISHPNFKKRQQKNQSEAGVDYDLNLVDNSMIDGNTFKSLTHGMDASLWDLACINEYNILIHENKNEIDYLNKTKLAFDCHQVKYNIKHNYKKLPVHAEIEKENIC